MKSANRPETEVSTESLPWCHKLKTGRKKKSVLFLNVATITLKSQNSWFEGQPEETIPCVQQ